MFNLQICLKTLSPTAVEGLGKLMWGHKKPRWISKRLINTLMVLIVVVGGKNPPNISRIKKKRNIDKRVLKMQHNEQF